MRKYIYYFVSVAAACLGTFALLDRDFVLLFCCIALFLMGVDAAILFNTCLYLYGRFGDENYTVEVKNFDENEE